MEEGDEQEVKDAIIPLCITDLLATLLFSKVDQTVEKYLQKIKQSVLLRPAINEESKDAEEDNAQKGSAELLS